MWKAVQLKSDGREDWIAFIQHMKGQIYFHLGVLLMKHCEQVMFCK